MRFLRASQSQASSTQFFLCEAESLHLQFKAGGLGWGRIVEILCSSPVPSWSAASFISCSCVLNPIDKPRCGLPTLTSFLGGGGIMYGKRPAIFLITTFTLICGFLLTAPLFAASKEKVLHSFNPNNNQDGSQPSAGLISDASGNLYGTTSLGNNFDGAVFELVPGKNGQWTEKVLYSFVNGKRGSTP